jgi:hypothetical protein
MWGIKMRFYLGLAAAAATLVAATPALAATATATVPDATAKGTVLLPLTLTESKILDFGTVIASPTVAGNVVIDADNGSRTVGGGVIGVPNYPGQRAIFQGAGSANQVVVLKMSPPTVLTSGANSLTVNSMTFDSGGGVNTTRTIDATGAFSIGVGGDFAIAANQPNGVYTATYTVTADYQ